MPVLVALALAGALLQPTDSGTLSGRVIENGTNAPVAGARVMVMQDRRPGPFGPGDRPLEAVTGADGRFTIERVPPGHYRLNVDKAGFAMLPGSLPLPVVEVRVGERATAPDLTLARGGAIAGRVIDENGEPVINAFVRPMRRPPGPRGRMQPGRLVPAGGAAQTNDIGEFRVHSLAPGDYYVQAAPAPGHPSATAAHTTLLPTFFPGTAEPAAAQPIAVAAGQTTGDVVIRILSGAAFEISGVVVDDGGNPVSGAMVSVTSDPSRGSVLFGGPGMNQSRTDTHGRFVIAGIPDGEYILNAAAPLVMSNGASSGGTGGVGGFTAWSTSGVIGPSGPAGGSIVTEMRNGTTIQFRTDPATAQHLTVNGANVTGVQLVARRPAP